MPEQQLEVLIVMVSSRGSGALPVATNFALSFRDFSYRRAFQQLCVTEVIVFLSISEK